MTKKKAQRLKDLPSSLINSPVVAATGAAIAHQILAERRAKRLPWWRHLNREWPIDVDKNATIGVDAANEAGSRLSIVLRVAPKQTDTPSE